MIEQGVDGFFSIDADWRYDYVSEEGARLAGRSGDDLRGEYVWDTFPELEDTEFGDFLRTAMDSREASRLEAYYPPRETRYDVRAYPTEDGLSVYFRDVTELRERARQFEAIFDNTYTFVGLLDPDGTLLEANDTALEFGGIDREAVIGEPIWETYWFQANRHARRTARDAVDRARRGEQFQDEVRIQGSDREAVIDFTVRPVTNEEGDVEHLVPEGHDVTEREQLTRELRRERDFVEQALDTLDDVFYVVGPEGGLRRWNGRVPDVTGYTEDEISEMQAVDFFPDDERERVSAAIEETLATGRAEVEADLLTADGERIPYEFTGARLTDTTGSLIGLVGIGRDVSEKKARERELETKRERLEALNSLNTVVRDITDAVIEQSSRDDIERITCEKLTGSDSYTYAWIADADPSGRDVRPRVEMHGGCSRERSERLLGRHRSIEASPARATFRRGETSVARDVVERPEVELLADAAEEFGSSSFVSVPIVHDETQFGVLGVHSDRSNAFGEEEREIIVQLGEVIGYICYSIERRETLGSAHQLEFRSERLGARFPSRGDDETDLSLETVVPLDGEEVIEYWEMNDEDVEAFERVVERHDPELNVRFLRTVDGTARVEVSGGASPMSAAFTARGGEIRSAYLTEDAVRMVGEFPESVDPEAITEELREPFPDVELVSQTRVLTPEYLRQMVEENLTERQRTVLQLAYFGDYFGQPRRSTGEELADHLEITRQTFHHHLREAESKVFGFLFEDPADPLI